MLITLTTDFGAGSPYVAAMKGVILSQTPEAHIIDLSHAIPPQDLRFAHFFLSHTISYFPLSAIHVVVVDPGVGSNRRLLCIEAAGHRLLAPDNGCWTGVAGDGEIKVRALAESHLWRQPVSPTFHGRDILAPVAAQLARGLDPVRLGPAVTDWVQLDLPEAIIDLMGQTIHGEVVCVDAFGNLITNIPERMIENMRYGIQVLRYGSISMGGQSIQRWVRSYADAEPGALVALISSFGTLEIAVVQGNAAQHLSVGPGAPVLVRGPRDV